MMISLLILEFKEFEFKEILQIFNDNIIALLGVLEFAQQLQLALAD